MEHFRECPVCLSEKITLHLKCTDHFISNESFEVYRCTSCSFEFTQDPPDITQIEKYYESDNYISHSDTSKGFTNKVYRLSRNILLHKKRRIIENFTQLQNGSILDIGSGTGYFAASMKKAGWRAMGIELNKRARDIAKSKFGLTVNSPETIPDLESNSYDCITLWHVLEHFQDPFTYISDLFRLLKPGGICVVALPNCSSFDARHYKQYWAAYDVPRHLWHFNISTFTLFVQKSGFKLENIRILPLDVFYISILSEKYKGSNLSFISGVVKGLVFSISSLFNKSGNSSIIYILRK